jgi:hypothetical protein
MTNLLRLIAKGADSIADTYVNPRAYNRPPRDGFLKDQEQLRADVVKVGSDMNGVIVKHGKPYSVALNRK